MTSMPSIDDFTTFQPEELNVVLRALAPVLAPVMGSTLQETIEKRFMDFKSLKKYKKPKPTIRSELHILISQMERLLLTSTYKGVVVNPDNAFQIQDLYTRIFSKINDDILLLLHPAVRTALNRLQQYVPYLLQKPYTAHHDLMRNVDKSFKEVHEKLEWLPTIIQTLASYPKDVEIMHKSDSMLLYKIPELQRSLPSSATPQEYRLILTYELEKAQRIAHKLKNAQLDLDRGFQRTLATQQAHDASELALYKAQELEAEHRASAAHMMDFLLSSRDVGRASLAAVRAKLGAYDDMLHSIGTQQRALTNMAAHMRDPAARRYGPSLAAIGNADTDLPADARF